MICLLGDDRHLVQIEEKDSGTLLRYIKLHCDERLQKLFSESSYVFVQATYRRDYTADQHNAPTGVAPPNKKIKLRSQVLSVRFLFNPTYIYTQMGAFAKIVNGFKPLAISAKALSWMFDSVFNTRLIRLKICKLGLKTKIYLLLCPYLFSIQTDAY